MRAPERRSTWLDTLPGGIPARLAVRWLNICRLSKISCSGGDQTESKGIVASIVIALFAMMAGLIDALPEHLCPITLVFTILISATRYYPLIERINL